MTARLPILIALWLTVAVPGALATTEPERIVGVDVVLKPTAVTLSSRTARRGSYVEFRVRNATARRRSFSVGGRTIAVPARKYRLLVVLFDVRGKYTYASGRAPGPPSRGTFTIG